MNAWNRDRVYCRGVYEINKIYYMVVAGGKQYTQDEKKIIYSMGMYVSLDGINWIENDSNPVMTGEKDRWYEGGVIPKSPVYITGFWYMAFESFISDKNDTVIARGIGLAQARKLTGPWEVITRDVPIIDTRHYRGYFSDIEHPIIVVYNNDNDIKQYGIIAAVTPRGSTIRNNFESATLALWTMGDDR